MTAVGKPPRRSKAATLDMLQRELGAIKIAALDRERLIQFGRARSEVGAGPVTLGIDIGTIGLVLSHTAVVHGLPISTEQVTLARIALKRLGLVGQGMERDRRPTESELESLIALFEVNERQITPVGRIIRFAIATAMRLDEICRVDWADVNERTRMLLIRDRKDPRNKLGTPIWARFSASIRHRRSPFLTPKPAPFHAVPRGLCR
jgi:integrase